jgi:hypothetical protein
VTVFGEHGDCSKRALAEIKAFVGEIREGVEIERMEPLWSLQVENVVLTHAQRATPAFLQPVFATSRASFKVHNRFQSSSMTTTTSAPTAGSLPTNDSGH